jgi:Cu+-exporting ATPase
MIDTIEDRLSAAPEARVQGREACFHCGELCDGSILSMSDKVFCCNGCLTVHDLLAEIGLGHFYDLRPHPGIRVNRPSNRERWAYLDKPELGRQLLDFSNEKVTRVTFHIPGIHCIACVWLLENLFQLHPGIGRCVVNFPKREVVVSFATGKLLLSELVALLASIGYEPEFNLGKLERPRADSERKRQWLQIGIAGFAFGNIMLFSLPTYLGMDSLSGPAFKTLFGWLSLGLALPVVVYGASDYWRSALVSVRQRVLTLDVPIALGLGAIYGQSVYEISSGTGFGYCDSLAGLIFFLLCGRFFQKATYDRMIFDRDYKCFLPLSVVRKTSLGEETIAISEVRTGDRLILRNGELIPADATLVSGQGRLDYSFVTGESEPVRKGEGDYLYAGGAQLGGAIEVETAKPVSQSYLTSLWNDDVFKKDREDHLNTLTNHYSRRFTRIVLAVAVGAGLFWLFSGNPARAAKAFASVLIVACPCALALAAPFALGTAQRLLARVQVFLKNSLIVERLAQVDTVVFDKTGTLTARTNEVTFETSKIWSLKSRSGRPEGAGVPGVAEGLSPEEERAVFSLARHSTHPHAKGIGDALAQRHSAEPVEAFVETPGCGIGGEVSGQQLRLGSRRWLEEHGIAVPDAPLTLGSVSHLVIGGQYRGSFVFTNALRPEIHQLMGELKTDYEIALLSGDNERERKRFQNLLGMNARLLFSQSPLEKLGFVRTLQETGKTVMMVGDGLNDAGALRQSNVGIAVVEKVGAFSPASDVILEASQVAGLAGILSFARLTARIVWLSFGISAAYNLVGMSIAAAGLLSPLVCAVLMPVSSVSVVLFACGATKWAARRKGVGK